jgi:ankyrin repeat protein
MKSDIVKILQNIINQYGNDVCSNPAKLRALLKDFYPNKNQEINLLVTASEGRIPADLTCISKNIPVQFSLERLIKRLEDNYGLSRLTAKWAVETWAIALGVISRNDNDLSSQSYNRGKLYTYIDKSFNSAWMREHVRNKVAIPTLNINVSKDSKKRIKNRLFIIFILAFILHLMYLSSRISATESLADNQHVSSNGSKNVTDHGGVSNKSDAPIQSGIQSDDLNTDTEDKQSTVPDNQQTDDHDISSQIQPTPSIFYAAYSGDYHSVDQLISQGADVNKLDANGISALLYAVYSQHPNVAELLLEHSADVNAKTPSGYSSLMIAADSGNANLTELLLEHSADVNAKTPSGYSSLMIAADSGNANLTELLLEHGAAVNEKEPNGSNVLMNAILYGHKNIAEMLIEHGADVNARDAKGINPLMAAAYRGDLNFVESLLEHGADVNATDSSNHTVLYYAAKDTSVERLLLQHNAR